MDLIIVLGAQNDAQGRLSAMALARARGALEVYRERTGRRLVVTGGYGHFNPAPLPHAAYMARYLIAQGVDPTDILAQVESAHTVEDAALTRQFLDVFAESGRADSRCADSARRHSDAGHSDAQEDPFTLFVVTSDVHVPRARLIFEHFFRPARLVTIGTPDALSPQRLQELRAHEREQIARIRRQGGVIYQGRLLRQGAQGRAG